MNEYQEVYGQHTKAERIWKYDKHSRALLRKKKDIVAADTETTGLLFHRPSVLHDDHDRIVENPFPFGLTLAFPHKDRLVLVWGRYGSDLYKACQDVFASACMKVWHNSKYDLRVCRANDIEVNGAQLCTLTMSRIYWDRRRSHSLQSLSEFICPGISDWEDGLKKELTKLRRQWSKRKDEWNPGWAGDPKEYVNYSFLPDEMIGEYSQTDVFMVWQLFRKLSPYMADEYSEIFDREMAVTHVVTKIEEAGMGFDVKRGRAELKKLLPKIKLKRRILDELSPPDFTLGPKKILEALKFLGVKSKQLKVKGKETTAVDVLNQAVRDGVPKRAERFIKVLLDFRAYSKIANTYLGPLTEQAERTGGTVYTTINPTDSRTGRPASRDPNLLNIPNQDVKQRGRENHVRDCFVPRSGGCKKPKIILPVYDELQIEWNEKIYYFDIAQQEFAMLFSYAGADELLKAYMGGKDLHQYMADLLGRPDKRKIVKNQNFAVAYGTGIKHMAAMMNLTIGQAKEEMKIYNNEFPFIRELQLRLEEELRMYGYVLDYFGRKYHVPIGQAYKAVNAIVQGGCAQAFKQGLLQVDELLESKRYKSERRFCKDVVKCMSEVNELMDVGLRFRVDVKRTETNWAEKKELKI